MKLLEAIEQIKKARTDKEEIALFSDGIHKLVGIQYMGSDAQQLLLTPEMILESNDWGVSVESSDSEFVASLGGLVASMKEVGTGTIIMNEHGDIEQVPPTEELQ